MKPETKLIDQEHRDRAAQDLSGSYIVEAAAGTGKTTVLVTRIINLIKAGEARLDEVVAITFTEKAAAEFKVKLRQELEKVLQAASVPTNDSEFRGHFRPGADAGDDDSFFLRFFAAGAACRGRA